MPCVGWKDSVYHARVDIYLLLMDSVRLLLVLLVTAPIVMMIKDTVYSVSKASSLL